MKKSLVTIISLLLFANVSYAQFSMPKTFGHKKDVIKPVEKQVKEPVTKTSSVDKISKSEKTESTQSKLKLPKFTHTKTEQQVVKTNTEKNVSKKNKLNINIKNPLRKEKQQVGEDLVSKEQIKEELTRVHNLSQQAVALYTDNNLDDSLNTFLKIPEKYRSAQDYVLMGNILSDLGRREDAIFMYKRAILTDEFNYKAYYNIGNICLNDDKYFMAIDYYKKAKKYASDFPYVYYNLGCAYIKAGDLKKAKSNLAKAIELKNTEPDFHYNLAYVYKKLDKPKLAKMYLENYNKLTNGQ